MHYQLAIRILEITLFPRLILEVKILKQRPSERPEWVFFRQFPWRSLVDKLIHLVLKECLGLFLAYLDFMNFAYKYLMSIIAAILDTNCTFIGET